MRSDNTGTVEILVNVPRGICPTEQCTDGMIQNLDLTSCECELMSQEGELFVFPDTPIAVVQDLALGDKYTIREYSTNTDPLMENFPWFLPDNETMDDSCVSAFETYEDPWGRYRQVIWEAVSADCSITMNRINSNEPDNLEFTQNLTIIVWPTGEPPVDGDLYNLDEGDFNIVVN
jgi:hypothetical protein